MQVDAPLDAYLPATQVVQVLIIPTPDVPVGQLVQLGDPAGEYLPSTHNMHSVAPLVLAGYEYFPIPHSLHKESRPSPVEYVPSAHSSQSVSVVLEQALHPVYRLYFPAEQRIQGPPLGPHRPENEKCQKHIQSWRQEGKFTWDTTAV